MAKAVSNRILPVLASIVIVMLVVVTLRACTLTSDSASTTLNEVPVAPRPDVDTPADTIKTLTANVVAMSENLDGLREDNAALHSENAELRSERRQIEDTVGARLNKELDASRLEHDERRRRDAELFASLSQRLDRLNQSFADASSQSSSDDMPVGLGFDTPGAPDATIMWINPLDEGVGNGILTAQEIRLPRAQEHAHDNLSFGPRSNDSKILARLAYTVPRNATLIGATAMTALVGRVPTQGQVRDAMPFKVITGYDNLAANGLTVPGVQGMVWSGTAVGDWTLSCVTGRLDSVTFVFDDGTIQTISSDQRAGQGGNDEPLAWISDDQGIPCVSGDRKSNAATFLAQSIGAQAVQAASDAAAAAQTTTVIGQGGSVVDRVTGDIGPFVLGKTISGGSAEVAKWLLERQSQHFDAVFVAPGATVAIHVDRELRIDFDPNDRRLHYGHARRDHRDHRLD